MSVTPPDRQLHAAAFMICAMAVIGVIDNFIAPLSRHIGLWQFHLMRATIAWPLVAVLPLLGLGGLMPIRFWAVALRSLLVGISMLFYFSALAMMPIAQALAGLYPVPRGWPGLPDEQRRRAVPARCGPRPEIMALRRVRTGRPARRRHVHADRHRQAERHRSTSLARRRHRSHRRHTRLAAA